MRHIQIERLYDFVMNEQDLTGTEQSHLVVCKFCVAWLDACVTEKVSVLMNHLTKKPEKSRPHR